jgi:hypothetical protein
VTTNSTTRWQAHVREAHRLRLIDDDELERFLRPPRADPYEGLTPVQRVDAIVRSAGSGVTALLPPSRSPGLVQVDASTDGPASTPRRRFVETLRTTFRHLRFNN